ncbi:MAG TPA: GDP-mannose 4,6-dehydratase, partial [Ferruginibacter sp.]|nr:GDP-mannose 4,6-dehydratase [Ferruginibacter sp.]
PIGKEVVAVDPEYFRPTEVDLLIGDATKAKQKLGWVPKHDLASLVKEMVEGDVQHVKRSIAQNQGVMI